MLAIRDLKSINGSLTSTATNELYSQWEETYFLYWRCLHYKAQNEILFHPNADAHHRTKQVGQKIGPKVE